MVAFAATRPKLPVSGVVPDEQTAVKIADAIFQPVFGITEGREVAALPRSA